MTRNQPLPVLGTVLPAWMAKQRWYSAKGQTPELERVSGTLLASSPDAELWLHHLRDVSGDEPVDYQVPLVWRATPNPDLDGVFVAEVEVPGLGVRHLYDAPHDPWFAQVVLDLVVEEGSVGAAGAQLVGHRTHIPGVDSEKSATVLDARVLTGEQSNTSVVVDLGPSRTPLILKVFRVLHAGRNPDVVVQTLLAEHGSELIPAPRGHLEGTWTEADGTPCSADLAFVQTFLRGVQDAWQVALSAAEQDFDFAERAYALGEATARIHTTLAEAAGTHEATGAARAALAESFSSRLEAACQAVPELGELRGAAAARFERALDAPWPRLQRIHGDFHLGQVLDAPEQGWIILDFEGEPLRPLEERNQPDLTLRDVAGMLRSFDYAAGTAAQQDDSDHSEWASSCRERFLAGYRAVAGDVLEAHQDLLDALTLDKAFYEVVYEARNRPDWLPLPLEAVHRLLDEEQSSGTAPDADPQPLLDSWRRPTAEKPLEEPMTGTSSSPTPAPLPLEEAARLVTGHHYDPHSVLGAHVHDGGVTIRALRVMARAVTVVLPGGRELPMEHEHEGIWTVVVPDSSVSDYRLRVTYEDGQEHLQDDAYRFLPTLGEVDLHLIGEGRHEQLWKVLGSHVRSYSGELGEVHGTSFAVWAPNAQTVRLVGDMNHWDGTALPMRSLGSSGVWEVFVPGVGAGTRYKYEILAKDGVRRTKADPLARATECPPATASVVTESEHAWGDRAWMTQRAEADPHGAPMSVYEVHLGSWRQGSSYRDLAEHLVNYVADLGFTHVELMPVAEHPYGPSWGYQVTGYYAPTARFGSPDDFRYLVDRLHQAGIGVIVDWVPAHFPKDAFALARFDGEPLYEHPDPRRGDQPDWGTHVFDFGRPQVRNFLVANAVYWMEEFHIDALRVDAVASMLYLDYSRKDGEWFPNVYGGREHLEAVQMLQETNATVYRRCPGVTMIAEESTAWPGVTRPTHLGGLGFGFKWNMGWMHDTLHYAAEDPMYRQYHHHELTFGLVYAFSENYVLPISHDEVVYGKGSLLRKMPGDRWQQLANVRAYLAFMWAHPGKQLIFMGTEFAQESEWADGRSLDWWLLDQPAHWGVHALVKDLNAVYKAHPALWQVESDPSGFAWIEANDAAGNTLSFVRYGTEDEEGHRPALVAAANFAGNPHHTYRIGLPRPGRWNEVLNTDAGQYGGSGVGNLGFVEAEEIPWQGQPCSAEVTLPPLGVLWLAQG